MAVYTTIDDPGSYLAYILTLSGSGATRSVTYGGANALQPDLVWAKCRSNGYNNNLCDSVRGATKIVKSDSTAGEVTDTDSLTAFGADGFTMGTNTPWNGSGPTYVYWGWKAGTTSGITTDGSTTITPNAYSFNQTAGISILKFTGNQVNGAKLAHGLGVVPEMVFFKTLEGVSTWGGYNKTITATDYIKLDSTAAQTSYALAFADTEPDAVNITLGSWEATNGNVGMEEMIAYAFASVKGYSKIGSYTGNGNADGPFIYTGFRPAFTICKIYNGNTNNWKVVDDKRPGYNLNTKTINADSDAVEGTEDNSDYLSNGFKLRRTGNDVNGSGYKYIYISFAANPCVNSEGVPGNAR